MKVVAVDGLINMFKDARARLNPRDYHSLVEYDTRDTMFLNFIQMLQLADGVELVKCEDCKYWGDTICERFEEERIMFADDFCSYGERSEP